MSERSDHLLRTFAAVPVESRVLDVGCQDGLHAEALVQLGFDVFGCDASPEFVEEARARLAVHVGEEQSERRISRARIDALGYPDEFVDWIVTMNSLASLDSREAQIEGLAEIRRVLRSGGWLYVAVPAVPERELLDASSGCAGDSTMTPTFSPRTLDELMKEVHFAVADRPSTALENGRRVVRAIYRRVDEGTPA